MERQKRVLAVHDISGVGRCSLTVALPIISAAGVECSVLPTAVLSTHTGGFTGYTCRDLTEDFLPMLLALHDALAELRWTTEPRIAVETALLSVCRSGGIPTKREESMAAGARDSEAGMRVLAARIEALEKKLAAGAAVPLREGAAPRRDTQGVKKTPSTARTKGRLPGKAEAASGASLVKTEAGEALWKQLLAALEADGEKVVLACAVNGMFGGMTDQYFCVQFTSAFLANRLKKDDFRKVLEAYLERLSGSPLRLTVEVEELSEAPKKTKEATPTREKSAKEAVEALPPEARAAVEPLVEIFGDDMKIVPAEEMNDGIQRQEPPPADM